MDHAFASRKSHVHQWCPCQALHEPSFKSNHGKCDSKMMRIRLHPDKYYCHSCIQVGLQEHHIKHENARIEHDKRQAWCADQIKYLRHLKGDSSRNDHESHITFNAVHPTIALDSPAMSPYQKLAEDQDTLKQLRQRLSYLQLQCNMMAMDLATVSCQNEERANNIHQQREIIASAQEGLEKLFHSILTSQPDAIYSKYDAHESSVELNAGLSHAIQQYIQQVRKIRFQLALQVFSMFDIDLGQEYLHLTTLSALNESSFTEDAQPQQNLSKDTRTGHDIDETKRRHRLLQKRIPTGVGKISGLPLPHAGPALYGIMPSGVLTSSLRLAATLTTLLAKCVGISLPHPILLHPPKDPFFGMKEQGDIIHDLCEETLNKSTQPQQHAISDLVSLQDVLDLGYENSPGRSHQDITNDSKLMSETNVSASCQKSVTFKQSLPSLPSSTLNSLSISSSTIISMMKSSSNKLTRSAHKVLDKMTGQTHHGHKNENTMLKQQKKVIIPTMDYQSVQQRLQYAVSAKVCEGHPIQHSRNPAPSSMNLLTTFDLKPTSSYCSSSSSSTSDFHKDSIISREETYKQEENFKIALELLQNNIVALCIHSGVPISTLWPAEAILLNLHSFMLFCRNESSS